MKQYEEVMLSAEELRELLVLGRQSETIKSEEVARSLCYNKIMSLDNLTFPPLDGYVTQLELLADMVGKSHVRTVDLRDFMINESHQTVLKNLAKSESLHTLYIKFNNMRLGTALSASELKDSKSLNTIYISFNGIFNHSRHYCEIVEPVIKIPTLCNLTFKFLNQCEAKFFVGTYKLEIDSIVEKRPVEICPQIIRENFYQSFTALHYSEMQLHADIIGVIAKHYANLSTLNVDYGLDCG
jgi:hypothetical protein